MCVHPSGHEAILSWGLLWNPLTCASLAGPKHLIDEKTAGDLMPLLLRPWCQNYTPRVSTQEDISANWNHGGNKIYMVPLNIPQIHFREGGNTICRMLALQKEIGLGRGWGMKMNGTIWSLGVCVCGTDSKASGPIGTLWCGWHLYRQVYLAQQSELKLSWASVCCLPIQRRLPFLTWEERRFFFFLIRCVPPLMTQGADREVCVLESSVSLWFQIIKIDIFSSPLLIWGAVRSAEDDRPASFNPYWISWTYFYYFMHSPRDQAAQGAEGQDK